MGSVTPSRDPDFLGWAPDEPLRWVPELSIASLPLPTGPAVLAAAPATSAPEPSRPRPPAPPTAAARPAPVAPAVSVPRGAAAPGYPLPVPVPQGLPPVAAPAYPPPAGRAARVPAARRQPASPLRGPTLLLFLVALGFTIATFFAPAEAGGSLGNLLVQAAITVVLGRLAWGMRPR